MTRIDPDTLKVRFQGNLKKRLMEAAAKNTRSLNSEIMARLEESFKREGDIPGVIYDSPDIAKLIIEMHSKLMGKKNAPRAKTASALPQSGESHDASAIATQSASPSNLPKSGTASSDDGIVIGLGGTELTYTYFRARKPKAPRGT